jgi:hypothetical protein
MTKYCLTYRENYGSHMKWGANWRNSWAIYDVSDSEPDPIDFILNKIKSLQKIHRQIEPISLTIVSKIVDSKTWAELSEKDNVFAKTLEEKMNNSIE